MSRPRDSGRLDLRELFHRAQQEMLAQLHVGGLIEHGPTAGAATERHWIALFERYLPKRYKASSAFVIDSRGNRSRQIDLAVYDHFYSPLLFPQESAVHIPAESVYAVFEVKPSMSRALVRDAAAKVASVRAFHRTSAPLISAGKRCAAVRPNPILGGLLAATSLWGEALEAFPKKDSLPVMVWGNGGCAIDSTRYAGFLTTIASHGFLVMGTVPQTGAARRQETADDVRAAIDWATKENARMESPLKGKIALDKVAVMGQSCGGFLSIVLGADPRVKTIGVFNSGVQDTAPAAQANGKGGGSPQPTPDALPKLHGPVLLINGGEPDFMLAASSATFDKIDKVPAFYGSRHNAGHTATVFHPGGGEFANVASNWLSWTFKGDKKAGQMFVGKNCSLCTNSNWDVKAKGIK